MMKITLPIIIEELNNPTLRIIYPKDMGQAFTKICVQSQLSDAAANATKAGTISIYVSNGECTLEQPGIYTETFEEAVSIQAKIQGILDKHLYLWLELKEAIINSVPIPEFLEKMATMLVNPVAVIDTSFVTLFHAGAIYGSVEGSVWDSVLNRGYFRWEEYSHELRNRLTASSGSREIVIYDPGYANQEVHVCVPICQNGETVAWIGSCDINGPFTQAQVDLLKNAQELLESALSHSHEFYASFDEGGFYVNKLIEGELPESKLLEHYLSTKKWRKLAAYQLLLIEKMNRTSPDKELFQAFRHRLTLIVTDCIVTIYGDYMVVIQHEPTRSFDSKPILGLRNFLEENDLICGISAVFHDFSNIEYAFQQAKIVTNRSTRDNSIEFFLTDYRNVIMESLYQTANIKAFCHPTLFELWQSGNANVKVYLKTIETFLNCGCNIGNCSRELNIHRNTLLYRMDRINESLGIDLRSTDMNQRLLLQVSCMILSFLDDRA